MNDETLTTDRAEALILAFGADPVCWPEEEREALQQCIDVNPQLRELLTSEQALDTVLAASRVQPTLSVAQVLAHTASHTAQPSPKGTEEGVGLVEAFLDWLCFGGRQTVWRSGLVAGVALAVGVGCGTQLPQEEDWSISEQFVFAPIEGGERDG